jgi:Xaa-Pro aminopeptidase
MSIYADRADRLTALMSPRDLDLLLVNHMVNVRYLCGFSGTNGVCLVGPGERVFITDFRYVERAKAEVTEYEVVRGKQDLLEQVVQLVQERASDGVRLGFEDHHMTVKTHARLASLLPQGVELVAAGGLVEELRAVKDDHELGLVGDATKMADELYRWLIADHGLAGHTELEVARALERRAQDIGADALSFPPIVAAAENGALPHAKPREVAIPRDSLVIIDLGCCVDGYNSDCTRTFATGEVDEEAREVYELVRAAQAAAKQAVKPEAECSAVDGEARARIEQAGRGDEFGHGTGHGVGLEVHEAPRIAPNVNGRLETGNVVTIEPGVYAPGRFGVRIEDLVVVRPEGVEVLTSIPRELTVVK